MDIRCPREECNTKINVAEAVLFNTNVQLKCPSCLRFFKPFDTLSELQKKDILKVFYYNKNFEEENYLRLDDMSF